MRLGHSIRNYSRVVIFFIQILIVTKPQMGQIENRAFLRDDIAFLVVRGKIDTVPARSKRNGDKIWVPLQSSATQSTSSQRSF